jgi:hypothetical protein
VERLGEHWNGFVGWNAEHYPVRNNGPANVRQPRHDDPYVQIDGFEDLLPGEFYNEQFLRQLEVMFPHSPPTQEDSGQDRFVALLRHMETYLYERYPDFEIRSL